MNLKGVIIFTLGVATGGLVATLFWREKYRQKYKKEADEKVESMLEYVNRLREKDKDGAMSAQAEYSAKSDIREKTEGASGDFENGHVRVNYADIYAKKAKAEQKLAESEYPRDTPLTGDERAQNEERMKDKSKEKPKIIKAIDYHNQYTWFDKSALLYYTEDGVLATEDDNEPVDDIERFVGDALDKFNFKSNDEEVLYVRNFSRGTDYEINKVFGAWEDS